MKQAQKQKQPAKREPEPVIEKQETPDPADQAVTDALLDEIDEVLEDTLQNSKNAQEFVKDFQQKGGE